MLNYNNKTFRSVSNSKNGQINNDTIFEYTQTGNIVTAVYQGGSIVKGFVIALADENGKLNMRYQHVNTQQQLMTGICISTPQLLPNGKIQLHEKWQWTCGDNSKGESVIEEV
jgi:cell division protein FtsI/penicillin-binding protein 2